MILSFVNLYSSQHACILVLTFYRPFCGDIEYPIHPCTGGLELHAHRAVLVASSDYFCAMLTGDMRESRESSVALQGVTGPGLQAVVDFAYSGKLKLSLDVVEEVLAAASHLQVVSLFRFK